MKKLFSFFVLVVLLSIPAWSQPQEERILNFNSMIRVHTDAGITVNEEITVYASGNQIKRGIYRSLPIKYKDDLGNSINARYDILAVTRDGHDEPYHIEYENGFMVIYIGDADVYLDPGTYTYTISYYSPYQIRFFPMYDELYWNVTGTEWGFRIEKAEATVRMPFETDAISISYYTGVFGGKGQDADFHRNENGDFVFTTKGPLDAREGLTFAFSFPKNIIQEPSKAEIFGRYVKDNITVVIALILLLLTLIYFVVAWFLVGRDPKKGAIPVLYFPPGDLSAGAMRYIHRMRFDKKAFTAAIVQMAVKKHLIIEQNGKEYTLKCIRQEASPLTPEELALSQSIFSAGDEVLLKNTNHTRISSAINSLKSQLKLLYQKANFFPNTKWFVPGLLASLVGILIVAISMFSGGGGGQTIWVIMFGGGTILLFVGVISVWRKAVTSGKNIAGAIFMTVFSIPFVAAFLVVSLVFSEDISFIPLVIILLTVIMDVLFHYLLKAPTKDGRKLMDKIEGFKEYLDTAEKDELNLHNSPDKTPELFERYLPYAIALGVENNWGERFNSVLQKAMEDNSYHPTWYSGTSIGSFSAASFATSLGGSFSSAVSSSSVSPSSSSSGSSGGGFSGGGGGGGGGGGW